MEKKWPLQLQRFAEPVPEPVPESVPEPMPEPTPPVTNIMPSGMAPEAWKNVEDMLVTLSNNIRVQVGALIDQVKEIREMSEGLSSQVAEVLTEVKQSMADFNKLLADATVEVPEPEVKANEAQKAEKKSRPGYLSMKG